MYRAMEPARAWLLEGQPTPAATESPKIKIQKMFLAVVGGVGVVVVVVVVVDGGVTVPDKSPNVA